MHKQKVITYSNSNGRRISLTKAQDKQARDLDITIRDEYGAPYVDVYWGLHSGDPTFSSEEWAAFLEVNGHH